MKEESLEIVFESPKSPRAGRMSSLWTKRLEPLTARPDEWARVLEVDTKQKAYAIASDLKRGVLRVPAGKWEFAGRQAEDGVKGFVYARFLGNG